MSDLKEAIERAKEAAVTTTEQVTSINTEDEEVKNATPEEEPTSNANESEDDGMILEEDSATASKNEAIVLASAEEIPANNANDDVASLKAELLMNSASAQTTIDADSSNANGYKDKTKDEWMNMIDEAVSKLNIPSDDAKIEASKIFELIMGRRKKLIIEGDLEGSELDEVLEKRLNREIESLENKYTGKNSTVVIEVPEGSADKINFSDIDKQKIEKSSKIQLVEVEKKDLGTLKIKKLNKNETKLKFIEKVNNKFISTYSIPLPLTGEFATFRGALLIEMLQTRVEKNELLQETVNKKASLAYKHYIEGVVNKIKDEKGITVMTYNDFINKFRYHDLDLMIYAITCASSGPMTVSDLTCSNCNEVFSHEFSVSSLLTTENFPEKIRARYEDIIKHHSQLKYIESIQSENDELLRVESPITNNIYDIGAPSIARAISLLNSIDQDDPTDVYILALALFVHSVFIYDPEDDEYIAITDEDSEGNYDNLISTLKLMPQGELTLLHDVSVEMNYTPEFIMKSKCPNCGIELVNNIPVNDLVFFVTPETPVETEMKLLKNGQKK